MSEFKYASGRRAALQCLDALLAREENIQLLAVKLQECFELDPVLFFDKRVTPLLPKNIPFSGETEETMPIIVKLIAGDSNDAP